MLDHYIKIRPFLNTSIWPDLLPILVLIPTSAEDAQIRVIFQHLKHFESVNKGLQRARLANPIVEKSKYMNLSFIKPDTCVVEQLF